jgi:predicted GNAT family acetyltransferase
LVFRRTDDAVEFRERTRALLEADEIGNSAILSVLARALPPKIAAWIESDRGEPLGAILRTEMPFGVLVAGAREAIEALADALPPASLDGVYANADTADLFADRFCTRTGRKKRLELEMTLYAATSVQLPPSPAGALRHASPGEVELLQRWFDEFAREAKVHAAEGIVQRGLSQRSLYVWDHEGAKCMTTFGDSTPHVSRVGWVYTPPLLRKTGYASALVAQLTHRALAAGKKAVTLTADVTNPASNSIYQRMGYTERGTTRVYEFIDA